VGMTISSSSFKIGVGLTEDPAIFCTDYRERNGPEAED